MEANIFFESWMGLPRVAIMAVCAYASLVFLLRITGKRTLSKMNAFDFVVTVALGSTLATTLLSKNVALLEGILAFALLIFLQLAVTWLSNRSRKFLNLIKAEPRLLYHQGEFVESALRLERVVKEEILQAVRNQGQADLLKVVSVVIETDGSFSIITSQASGPTSTLSNVLGPKREYL
jgi:uncharacterized membrane protein YcaP (DUF421 family)